MSIVAGVDFGTLSVRVSLFEHKRGRLGAGTAEYPLHRRKEDPDYATQSHRDHMEALVAAMGRALGRCRRPRRVGGGDRARHHRQFGGAGGAAD